MRITAIYGKDDAPEHTAEVAKEGEIEFLAEKPEDFFGNVLGDAMNFPGDFGNIYEGLYFYGSHLIEMMLSVFGYDLKSIIASKTAEDKISIIAKYKDYQVSLNYVNSPDYFIDAIYKSVNENKEVLI